MATDQQGCLRSYEPGREFDPPGGAGCHSQRRLPPYRQYRQNGGGEILYTVCCNYKYMMLLCFSCLIIHVSTSMPLYL